MILQNQAVPPQITNSIAKLNQLLRLYEIIKKKDRSQKQVVTSQIQKIVQILKNYQFYDKISKKIDKAIQSALSDPKLQPQISRITTPLNSSIESNKFSSNKIIQEKVVSSASISNNIKSSQKSQQKIQQKKMNLVLQQSSNSFKTPPYSSSDFSNEKSQQSCSNVLIQNFNKFCGYVKNNVVEAFVFNQDLFAQLKQFENHNYIFIFGVKNPDSSKVKKLNICTLMNFSKEQVFEKNVKNKFNKQIKQFQNNIRSPLGIIFLGKGIEDLAFQHIRFLAQIATPIPLLLIIKDLKQKLGQVYHFSNQTMDKVKQTNADQAVLLQKIKQEYKSKMIELTKFEILKDKQIITKPLIRTIASAIQSAPNAIQIESSNQCIKEQQIGFPYKFHTKFYVCAKGDYQVYLEENNIIRFKYTFKTAQFQNFRQFILKEDSPLKQKHFFISTSIMKENAQVSKLFFKLLLEATGIRDPFFLINFTGIKDKKTYIFLLNQNTNFSSFQNNEGIQLKNLQKEVKLFKTVAVITKANYKNYQCTTEQKLQGIQLKK